MQIFLFALFVSMSLISCASLTWSTIELVRAWPRIRRAYLLSCVEG